MGGADAALVVGGAECDRDAAGTAASRFGGQVGAGVCKITWDKLVYASLDTRWVSFWGNRAEGGVVGEAV